LGSVSFAVVVSKLMGLSDPRTYGSKNPGATNVLRSGNKAAAIPTLLGDAVKVLAGGMAGAALRPCR
jgi:glycerol-3-phosphate acyltransferase PlsY